jgi:hypothetical protein
MAPLPIKAKVRAIVMFGPATPSSGLRPAEYFQVTIDPNTVSPKGDYIRFGLYAGDEIVGWQKVEAMTVCEILGETDEAPIRPEGYSVSPDAIVTMRAVS